MMLDKFVINRRCLKIDKANAKAMIEGFQKNGNIILQSIYCFVNDMDLPQLITLDKGITRFRLSPIGMSLNSENYTVPYKYVAKMIKAYQIENNFDMWSEICGNGLFDIWAPVAPYKRFQDAKVNPDRFAIGLLRVYEIVEEFGDLEIHKYDRQHMLTRERLEVTVKKPLLSDAEFVGVETLLENVIKKYHQSATKTKNNLQSESLLPTKSCAQEMTRTVSEQNLENILVDNLDVLEKGLILLERQYSIPPVGRIDLLCKDAKGDYVVVELKKYRAPTQSIIDQIAGYMGYVKEKLAKDGQNVRGIVVVGKKDERLEYVCKVMNLTVKCFQLKIE